MSRQEQADKIWADYHADVATMEALAHEQYGRIDYWTRWCISDRGLKLCHDLGQLVAPDQYGLTARIAKKMAQEPTK